MRRSRASAGSGLIRRSTRISRCCCTINPTTSGASTSSSAGTPTPSPKNNRSASFHACARFWARTSISSWNGSASIRFHANAWTASATAACSSSAMQRIGCRRSVRAAPTAACRMPRTSRGNCAWCLPATRPTRCSTRTRASASSLPTTTSATPPARPTSSRPRAQSAGFFAMPRCAWPSTIRLRGRWSTAGGSRCRRCLKVLRCRQRMKRLSPARSCPALSHLMRRYSMPMAAPTGC